MLVAVRSTCILAALAVSPVLAGCAHDRAEPTTRAPDDDGSARLARENAALRRRVQMLEDRVLNLEQRGGGLVEAPSPGPATSHYSLPDGRRLPVVRLGSDGTAPPARPPAGPVASTTSHVVAGSSVSVPEPEAYDADRDEPDAYVPSEPERYVAEPHAAVDDDDGAKSYRLVGSRLVDLTIQNAPKRPDRPTPGKKGARIVAEYDAAMTVYKTGAFADAEAAFSTFAKTYPRHDYADNALYWKGEAAYDQEHFSDALAAFTEVVERYGGGNKAPDALLKIGLCYRQLGDSDNARDVLTQLISAYPGERASDIARVKLAQFGS